MVLSKSFLLSNNIKAGISIAVNPKRRKSLSLRYVIVALYAVLVTCEDVVETREVDPNLSSPYDLDFAYQCDSRTHFSLHFLSPGFSQVSSVL
jgi:hypothetical protein